MLWADFPRRSSELSSATPLSKPDKVLPLDSDREDHDEGHSPYAPHLPSFQLTTPPRSRSSEPKLLTHGQQSPSVSTPQQTTRDHDWSAARLSLPMPQTTSHQVQQWTPPALPPIHEQLRANSLLNSSHASSSSYPQNQGMATSWSDAQTAIVPAQRVVHRGASHLSLVLEDTLPRDTAVYMVSLYFDYVRIPKQDRSRRGYATYSQLRCIAWFLAYIVRPSLSGCAREMTPVIPCFTPWS